MGVGHQRGQNIDHGIDEAAVPGVLDLLDVVDLVVMVSMMARLRNNSLSAKGMSLLDMFLRILVISCKPRSHSTLKSCWEM